MVLYLIICIGVYIFNLYLLKTAKNTYIKEIAIICLVLWLATTVGMFYLMLKGLQALGG